MTSSPPHFADTHLYLFLFHFVLLPSIFYLATLEIGACNGNIMRVSLFRWAKFYVYIVFFFILLFGCVRYNDNDLCKKYFLLR